MVIYGKPESLEKTIKKRKPGRPTQFDILLEMAKISWAPVFEYLSLLDSKQKTLEDLPLPEKPYNVNLGKQVMSIETRNRMKVEHWVSGKQIIVIHDDMIETFTGDMGIADPTLIDSLVDRAKNSKVYGHDPLKTIVHKAAFLMHGLLYYHPFVDGQKRTGLSTAFIFLGLNGYTFWSRNVLEEVHYCIDITLGKYEVDDIAEWLSDRIWTPKRMSGEQEAINKIIKTTGYKAQCTNFKCRGIFHVKSYRTKCPHCGREYELKITNVLFTHGINPILSYNIGLHKIEDSALVTSGLLPLKKKK